MSIRDGKPLPVWSHSEKDAPLSRFECTKHGDIVGVICERGMGSNVGGSWDVSSAQFLRVLSVVILVELAGRDL